MSFTWKAAKWAAIGVGGLLVVAVAVVYIGSAIRLGRTYEVAPITLNAPSPSATNGARLATLYGCKDCHKANGGVLVNAPIFAVLVAPNLSRVGREYSEAELVRVMRTGVKRNGASAIAMPTDSYAWLADDDVADIVAWLRSLKTLPDNEPAHSSFGPVGRLAALQGGVSFSADLSQGAKPPVQHPTGSPFVVGSYLAKVASCLHCHRLNSEHEVRPGTIAPPLGPMVQSYDLAQFTHLLRTGEGINGRKLGLMAEVAQAGFTHFSDEEIAALHTYLTSDKAEDNANAKAIEE